MIRLCTEEAVLLQDLVKHFVLPCKIG